MANENIVLPEVKVDFVESTVAHEEKLSNCNLLNFLMVALEKARLRFLLLFNNDNLVSLYVLIEIFVIT